MFIIKKKRLITVNVNYWMPDYNNILQEFIWQTDDYIPKLPRVHKFLNFWYKEIDAVISEVYVSVGNDREIRYTDFVGET
tara:strand:+ start:182 stop:421 length:240 start_codon:yes stop_codon:yes gene_type:complete